VNIVERPVIPSRAQHGEESLCRNPDTYSINGYSAMKVLLEGAKEAGTLEGSKVADAIRSLDITTPMGRVAYNANGDLKEQRIFIFQVKDGAFVQVSQ
jgi:branched-chain amino acid transport system substrate-binding protein